MGFSPLVFLNKKELDYYFNRLMLNKYMWLQYITSLTLLYRKIFWRIPAVGNVYSWKEDRFRWATVMLQNSSSTGASADLLVYSRWPGTFHILRSKEPIQHWSVGLCAVELGHLATLSGQKKMEVKVKHFSSGEDAQIAYFKFIYDGNSGKTFEGVWGYVGKMFTWFRSCSLTWGYGCELLWT